MNLYLIKDSFQCERYIIASNITKAIDIFMNYTEADMIIKIELIDTNIIMENN